MTASQLSASVACRHNLRPRSPPHHIRSLESFRGRQPASLAQALTAPGTANHVRCSAPSHALFPAQHPSNLLRRPVCPLLNRCRSPAARCLPGLVFPSHLAAHGT